jgi:glutathione S-transferase
MTSSAKNDRYSPYILYKSDVSYFSGKLEAYLHYKEIPHEKLSVDRQSMDRIYANTGTKKVPAMETANGQWLFDTTPLIQWLDQRYSDAPVLPHNPALRFFALLLEDYADEWLWRPSMLWRWMPRASRWALGWRIAAETTHPWVARPLGWYFGRRQLNEWLWDDGVTKENAGDVRDMLFRELEFLEPLLEGQPYILGSHPSVADYGYFGPMFRHFGNDPESAEVVRRNGPNTYEWLARLWNAKPRKLPAEQTWIWPETDAWNPLLERMAKDYLPYLQQNALAFQNGKERFTHKGNTFRFQGTKTTHYRVYCREVLQREFNALKELEQRRLEDLFAPHGGLNALHAEGIIESGIADQFILPLDPSTRPERKQGLKSRVFGQPRN